MKCFACARERVLASFVVASFVLAGHASAAVPPYPHSRFITAMTWDLSTVSTLRKAHGSDLWPLTWAADGNLYAAWGDGGGFDGDSNYVGRVSLGIARISGIPVEGNPASYAGRNVWGDAPYYAESRSTFGGKVDDLISIDGVLYGHGGLWTRANCNCPDPTLKSGANPHERTVTWSTDLGRTWQVAPWSNPAVLGSSLQYGQDYRGAWDSRHVYLYYQRDVNTDPYHTYLRRLLKTRLTADPTTPGLFQYLSHIDEHGTPSWSASEKDAIPVFDDPAVPAGSYAGTSVMYLPELGRYLLTAFHGDMTGQIGFFEGPTPWGPWATVAYYEDWGGFNESAGSGNGLGFPAKWRSTDDKSLWAVFSGVTNGFDSFNVVKATLTVSNLIPLFASPAATAKFSPGQRVTLTGSGSRLTWSVDRLNDGRPPIASGTGPTFTFTVPGNISSPTTLRITLAGPYASLYRDYVIQPLGVSNEQ